MSSLEFTLINATTHIREVVNGALFVMCGNLALILSFFMCKTWYDCRLADEPRWRQVPGIQTACVMAWILGVISVRSGLVWYSLKLANDGIAFPAIFEETASWVLVGSAIILGLATLRGTYIWTPPKWHNRAWAISVALTSIFLIASEYF